MSLYKISLTAKSRHIGSYHNDLINAKYAKEEAGYRYHIYQKVGKEFGRTSWIKVM